MDSMIRVGNFSTDQSIRPSENWNLPSLHVLNIYSRKPRTLTKQRQHFRTGVKPTSAQQQYTLFGLAFKPTLTPKVMDPQCHLTTIKATSTQQLYTLLRPTHLLVFTLQSSKVLRCSTMVSYLTFGLQYPLFLPKCQY